MEENKEKGELKEIWRCYAEDGEDNYSDDRLFVLANNLGEATAEATKLCEYLRTVKGWTKPYVYKIKYAGDVFVPCLTTSR